MTDDPIVSLLDDRNERELMTAFRELQDADAILFATKQKQYGPGNVNTCWDWCGVAGLLVRAAEKMERLRNAVKQGESFDFSTADDSPWRTMQDISNHLLIARLRIIGKWPGAVPDNRPT